MSTVARVRKEAAEAEKALQDLANSSENGSTTPPEGQNTPPEGQNPPENTPQNTFDNAPQGQSGDQWEQRYKTLQGMFAKINDQNAELRTQNAEFRGRLDELSAQMSRVQAPQNPQVQQPAKSRLLTEEEVKDYGAEFIDVTQRAAREVFEERIAEMQKRIEALASSQQTVQQTVQHAAKVTAETVDERYYNTLDKEEPEWEQINASQNFLTWLNEIDTFTGVRRQALLNQAFSAKDAVRTLAFFRAFKQTHNGSGATPNKPSVDTASLVAPETVGGSSPTPNSKRGKIWSQADVEKVYDDRVRGKITPQRFSELEKEIMAAVSEGRIK